MLPDRQNENTYFEIYSKRQASILLLDSKPIGSRTYPMGWLSAQCEGVVCALCVQPLFSSPPIYSVKSMRARDNDYYSMRESTVAGSQHRKCLHKCYTCTYRYMYFECKMMRVTFAHMLAAWNRSAAAATTAMKTLPKLASVHASGLFGGSGSETIKNHQMFMHSCRCARIIACSL